MKIKLLETLSSEKSSNDPLLLSPDSKNGWGSALRSEGTPIDPVSGYEIVTSIRCTEPQSEILVACMLGGDDANRAFNQSATMRLKGELSVAALQSAVELLIQRHESMRSVFDISANSFLVLKRLPVKIDIRLLSSKEDDVETAVESQVYADALHVFNLRKGPLFKATLLTNGTDHYFVFTLHHIVFDGWTLNLMVEELALLYNSLPYSDEPLPAPVRYSDYAREEHDFTAGPAYSKMKDYWLDQYKQYKPLPVLPYDFSRPEKYTYKSKTINFPFDKELLGRVKQVAEQHQCSLLVTMASMFEVLLYKLSGNKQFVLGIPTAGQPASGYNELMGHCVNLLPIQVAVDTGSGFSEYLGKRKKAYAEAFENRRVTLGSLLRTLKMERSASAAPFLPVTFNVYRAVTKEVLFKGVTTELSLNPREYSSFDMLIDLIRKENELEIICSYNEALFEHSTILSFLKQYQALVEQICRDQEKGIDELSIGSINEPSASRKEKDRQEAHKAYWMGKLKGDLHVLEIPTDKPRPHTKTSKYESAGHVLDKEIAARFTKLLQAQKATTFKGLVSVLDILLYRYTSQYDIIIGYKVNTHDKKDNIIALRCSFKGEDSFSGLLDNIGQVVNEAEQHRQYPFGKLLADLQVKDERSRNPLFDVMVMFDDNHIGTTKADLVFAFSEKNGALQINIHYDANLFSEHTIRRMFSHIDGLINAIIAEPSKAINRLDFLAKEERHQLLYAFNDTKTAYNTDVTLLDLFRQQLGRVPNNLAVTDGVNSITYSELDKRSGVLASRLREVTRETDQYIAVHMERSADLVVALIAVFKAGKAYLPLEPTVPADRKLVILNSVACSVLITDTLNIAASEELTSAGITIVNVIGQPGNPASEEPKISPADIAYVIFTSGSTGVPKGVIVKHQSVVNLIEWVNKKFDVSENDQVLSTASVSFDLSVYDVFGMLAAGASMRIATFDELRDPRLLSDILYREKITFWNSAPAVLHQLVHFFKKEKSSLRLVFLSGDWIPLVLPDHLKLAFPGVTVIALGGATEATVWSNYFQVEKIDPAWRSIPYGRPMQNAQYYILNEALQPAPIGVTGDLYIGGDVLAVGYTDAEISAKKFIPSPFLTDERIYHTGDKARFYPDGNIEFLGRVDDQVKIRGYRIELGDIENALQKYPKVERVIVLVKEESLFQKSLVAYIKTCQDIQPSELRSYLGSKLPAYFIPDYFIIMKEFPLTSNGKIDRKRLPKPEDVYSDKLTIDELVETETEKLIARIWREALGIENIRRNDNFFEIGGHSLKAIEVVLKLENETGFKLPMSSLLTHPSIKSLATLLESNEKAVWKYLVPIRSTGTKPPLYIVHGAGLGVMVFQDITNHMDNEQPVYGIQAMGLNDDESPAGTIEEIASVYLSEMLLQNPDGPYLLAGFSAGSVIAYEMARQLRAMGKTISFLGNFDFSLEFLNRRIPSRTKIKKMVVEFFPRQLHVIRSLAKYPAESWKFQARFMALRIDGLKRRLGYKCEAKAAPGIRRINEITDQYLGALSQYEIKSYDGMMDIFNSKIKIYYLKDNHYLGWKKFVTQGISIHPVEGDHDHIILPPNSKSFAMVLQQVIDQRIQSHSKNAGNANAASQSA